jgi:membrane protease YdiL (CAAX protease family)
MVENPQTVPKPVPPGKDRRLSKATRAAAEVFLLAAITLLPTTGLAAVAGIRAVDAGAEATLASPNLLDGGVVAALLIAGAQLLLMVLIMTRGGHAYGLRMSIRDLYQALPLAAGALTLLLVAALALQQLPEPTVEQLASGYRWRLGSWQQLPLAGLFVLLAAYREELFFRAFLLTRLGEQGIPPWLAVAASSLLFALGHLYQGVFAALVALLLGAYLGFCYVARPALHRVALAHTLFNVAVLAITLFPLPPFATFG